MLIATLLVHNIIISTGFDGLKNNKTTRFSPKSINHPPNPNFQIHRKGATAPVDYLSIFATALFRLFER